MKTIKINLDEYDNKKDFHLWLKKECDFPDYYGCNLDALYDCLSDNNDYLFEVYESKHYEDYLISLMEIFRDTNCEVRLMYDEILEE